LTLKDANVVSNANQKANVKHLLPMALKTASDRTTSSDAARDFVQDFPNVLRLSCGFSKSVSIED
jgi:hypothetical protein